MDMGAERVKVEKPYPWPLAWSAVRVFGSFLAFAVGGWVAAKVAGARRSETAMLHGAVAWLAAVPILVVLGSLGAAPYFGGWYGGLAGLPPALTAEALVAAQDPAMAMAARSAALAAVIALLLGLMGGVVGGWMGSGEPMTFTHHRTRRNGPRREAGTCHSFCSGSSVCR